MLKYENAKVIMPRAEVKRPTGWQKVGEVMVSAKVLELKEVGRSRGSEINLPFDGRLVFLAAAPMLAPMHIIDAMQRDLLRLGSPYPVRNPNGMLLAAGVISTATYDYDIFLGNARSEGSVLRPDYDPLAVFLFSELLARTPNIHILLAESL